MKKVKQQQHFYAVHVWYFQELLYRQWQIQ